ELVLVLAALGNLDDHREGLLDDGLVDVTVMPRMHANSFDHAEIRNRPSFMICCSSTQTSKCVPTTSMCVDEYQSAPVWTPYGLPKAMWTPGSFSSCRMWPMTCVSSMLVPMANSPTRSLFSSVWV